MKTDVGVGEVAKNAHPSMRKILTELVQDVEKGTVKGVILAHDKCDKRPNFKPDLPLNNKIFEKFKYRELIFPWLCVFYVDPGYSRGSQPRSQYGRTEG